MQAAVNQVRGIWIDSIGEMYIAEYGGHVVRRISAAGMISRFAGSGNPGYNGDGVYQANNGNVNLYHPVYAIGDISGNIFITDYSNHRIRKVLKASNIISTLAGNGVSGPTSSGSVTTSTPLGHPYGLTFDSSSENLYVSTQNYCGVYRIDLSSSIITQIVGSASACSHGSDTAQGTSTSVSTLYDIWADTGGLVYFVEYNGGIHSRLRYVNLTTRILGILAGASTSSSAGDGGPATDAIFDRMHGVSGDGRGNIYLSDENTVRRICQISGHIDSYTTLSGAVYSIFATSDGDVYVGTGSGYFITKVSRESLPSSHTTSQPSTSPSSQPSSYPSSQPTQQPVIEPSSQPSGLPSCQPSSQPTAQPTQLAAHCAANPAANCTTIWSTIWSALVFPFISTNRPTITPAFFAA